MAIRFTCQCGKPLKAREESAGRRTQCPQCGEPVGVPTLAPTHRGVTELPGETRKTHQAYAAPRQTAHRWTAPVEDSADRPRVSVRKRTKTASHQPAARKRRRRAATQSLQIRRRSGTRWSKLCGKRGRLADVVEFGAFNPVASVACLATALTLSVSMTVSLIPTGQQLGWTALPHGPFLLGALLLLLMASGYGCSWAGRVVSFAATGRTQDYAFNLKWNSALGDLARWVGCFFAGPVLPAAGGFLYWLNCGRMAAIDWLILAEFAFVATAWWLTLLVALAAGGGFRGMLPNRAFAVCYRLGLSGVALALLATALLFAIGTILAQAASLVHSANWGGALLLAACCVGGPLLLTEILRRLGDVYQRTEAASPLPKPVAPSQPAVARG